MGREFSVLFRLDRRSRHQGRMIAALTAVLVMALCGFGFWQLRSTRAELRARAVIATVQPAPYSGVSAFARCADIMDLAGEAAAHYSAPARPAPQPSQSPAPAPARMDVDAPTPLAVPSDQVATAQQAPPARRELPLTRRTKPVAQERHQVKPAPRSASHVAPPEPLPTLRAYRLRPAFPVARALAASRTDGRRQMHSSAMNR